MKKLKITTITLGILFLLLFIMQLSLEASYKDEVDLMQSVIIVSKNISAKEKAVRLNSAQLLGKEINKEITIVKAAIALVVIALFVIGFFYVKLYISRRKLNNQTV